MSGRFGLTAVATVLALFLLCSTVLAERVLVMKGVKTNEGTIDVYADSNAREYEIYYSYIPNVANPGRRAHISTSIAELRDELRRAKNNGWVVDWKRSGLRR